MNHISSARRERKSTQWENIIARGLETPACVFDWLFICSLAPVSADLHFFGKFAGCGGLPDAAAPLFWPKPHAGEFLRPSMHPSIGYTKADLGVVSARDDAHPQTGKGKRSEKGAKNRFCESPLINQIIDVCAPNHIDVCGDDMSLLFGISCCNHAIAEQLFPTIAYMDNQ